MKTSINDLTLNSTSEKLISKHEASDADVFSNREERELAIANWFFENTDKDPMVSPIYNHSLGSMFNAEGELIGYLYESYIDSGSMDYYYTIQTFF